MKNEVRMFLATEYEYRRGLAHKLLGEGVIDYCLAAINPYYNSMPIEDDRIDTVNTLPSGDDEYFTVCDLNELPAVDRELLEAMLPYESMALKMGVRRSFCYPIAEYEDEKSKYLQHLRFWNYMLESHKINFVLFACTPHSQGMYVVYGLARVKGIPLLILERPGIFDCRMLWGDSIESIGEKAGERYDELCKNGVNDFQFDDDIDADIQKFMKSLEGSVNNSHNNETKRSIDKRIYRSNYSNRIKEYYREFIRYNVRAILKPDTKQDLLNREIWFLLRRKQLRSLKYFFKHLMVNRVEYNKMAEDPDYSKKYICYFIHDYPEATVIPRGGVFAEQYSCIQLLARAAEKVGCYVYVREHPAATAKPKDLYLEIKRIRNVALIKSTVPSNEVIKNSVAIATLTGTCIVEAGLLGKPVLVFGRGHCYKKCPSVFEVDDEDQCSEYLRLFMSGLEISRDDMMRYLYAMQMETLNELSIGEEMKRLFDYNYVFPPFSLDSRVRLIREFINDHLIDKEKKV